jgi:hypothetical protein
MKSVFIILALFLATSVGFSQAEEVTKYFLTLTANETDTIPGQQVGGIGHGASGWLYIGSAKDVSYSATSVDSTHYTITVDYSDTTVSSVAGSSARTIGFKSYVVTLVTDTVANFPNEGNPKNFTSRVLRQAGATDNIPGGRYIRFRVTAPASAKVAGAAADRTIRVSVHLRRYAGN